MKEKIICPYCLQDASPFESFALDDFYIEDMKRFCGKCGRQFRIICVFMAEKLNSEGGCKWKK